MNTPSHVLMGKLVSGYIQTHYDIRLDERNFLRGNVLPDYLPSFISRPHFLKYSARYVQRLITNLASGLPQYAGSGRRHARYSLHLGILCHFYADFFCYAHSPQFHQGLKRHTDYENELADYFAQNFATLCAFPIIAQPVRCASAQDIYARFERLHRAYLASGHTFMNDLAYAIYACIDAIVAISRCRAQHADSVPKGALSRFTA